MHIVERYAVVTATTLVVVNVALWDGDTPWTPGEGFFALPVGDTPCGIGWTYDPMTGTFTPPPPTPPISADSPSV